MPKKLLQFINKLLPNKKIRLVSGILVLTLVIVGLALLTNSVSAGPLEEVGNGIIWAVSNIMLWISKIAISFAIFFLRFFIELAGYNNYIDAPTVKVGWTMVRDVANMFFVIVLLVIAIGTILGLEQYEWKKTLVKFVLAAVFINFSNLICGLIIDVAHIFTITFLNAVVGAAGGNFINMFKLDSVYKMTGTEIGEGAGLKSEVFIGILSGMVFAVLAAVTIGAYVVVMAARVVVLWVLIILSPLAYILQTMPQTQSYASMWWDKFGKQVMVAPIMVFFLWLAFATMGNGTMNQHLEASQPEDFRITNSKYSQLPTDLQAGGGTDTEGITSTRGENRVSLADVTTWENMSDFFIATAFLLIGIEMVNQMGVVGGSMVNKGVDFAKKVATIASGYAAGRWLAGKAGEGAKKGLGAAAWYMPVVGGEKWALRAKNEWEAIKKGYYNKAAGISPETIRKQAEAEKLREKLGVTDPGERQGVKREIKELETQRDKAKEEGRDEDVTEIEKMIQGKQATLGEADLGKRQQIEKQAGVLEDEVKEMSKKIGASFLGQSALSGLKLEKRLEKTKKEGESVKKMAWKRTGSEAGGIFFQRRANMFTGQPITIEAQDRIIRGMLAAEEMRSKGKDEEYENLGKNMVLSRDRFKNGKFEAGGTMMERITDSKMAAHQYEQATKRLESEAKLRIVLNFNKGEEIEKVKHDLENLELKLHAPGMEEEGKEGEREVLEAQIAQKKRDLTSLDANNYKAWSSLSGVNYNQYVESESMAKVTDDILKTMEDEHGKQRLGDIYAKGLRLDHVGGNWESGSYEDKATQKALKDLYDREEKMDKERAERMTSQVEIDNDETETREELAAIEGGNYETEAEKKRKSREKLLATRDAKIAALGTEKSGLESQIAAEEASTTPNTEKVKTLKKQLTAKQQELDDENAKKVADQENLQKINDRLTSYRTDKNGLKTSLVTRLTTLQQKREENEVVLKGLEEEKSGIEREKAAKLGDREREADIIRKGGPKAKELLKAKIFVLQQKAEGETDWTEKKRLLDQAATLQNTIADMDAGGSAAWLYGTAKGRAADVAKHHQYNHNELLSTAERREIWDKRGVATPSTAMTELIENAEKDFKEMGYDQYVSSVGTMFNAFIQKRQRGEEITESEKASMMGLFRRGFKESWVDDAIIGIMKNNKTRGDIGSMIGWTNNHFTKDKIGDVINLFQTAGDVDFTKKMVPFRELLDEVTHTEDKELQMSIPNLLEGIRTGNFVNADGVKLDGAKLGRLREGIEKHLHEIGRKFTREQQNFFDGLFDGQQASWADRFLEVSRENQASFQYMGNLRNEAIANGHVENSGWALHQETGGGERMYIASGVRQARDHGYGDFNKIEIARRLKSHPHVESDLNGDTQVSTGVRERDYAMKTSGVTTPQQMSGLTSRDQNVVSGIGATETASSYRRADGSFNAAESNLTQETWCDREDKRGFGLFSGHAEKKATASGRAVDPATGKRTDLKKLRKAFAARKLVSKVYLPAMRGNIRAWLMTMANQSSGVSLLDAALKGKMNLSLPVLKDDGTVEEKHFVDIHSLMNAIDAGDFGENIEGELPPFDSADIDPETLRQMMAEEENEPDATATT